MKRIPDQDWFDLHGACAVLGVTQGTLHEMIRTGEIWEPLPDGRCKLWWSFDALADACLRKIELSLGESPFANLVTHPLRRIPHSPEELETLRSWINAQTLRRRNFGRPDQATEWDDTHEFSARKLGDLQSLSGGNAKQRLGSFFAWVRRGARDENRGGSEEVVPFGSPQNWEEFPGMAELKKNWPHDDGDGSALD